MSWLESEIDTLALAVSPSGMRTATTKRARCPTARGTSPSEYVKAEALLVAPSSG